MHVALHTRDPDLRDLADGSPPLLLTGSDRPSGVRLTRWLGSGGMSTVFLAELDVTERSVGLSPATPSRLAVKMLKPSSQHEAERMNVDMMTFFDREVAALRRITERQPPTEFVVGFYGSGHSDLEIGDRTLTLPWLAIEYVENMGEGVTLTERVHRTGGDGVDPARAFRLLRATCEGACVLHDEGIIHRDLKPDNVLVAGPLDDETPKLSDCGIARIDGITGTVAAMTPAYGAPEQLLSKSWERNPLIGPWTDVHALAALAWFVLGGERWRRGDNDPSWHRGQRRSLRTAAGLHTAFASDPRLLDRLDAVLARGAAPRLPAEAMAAVQTDSAGALYLADARLLFPAMFLGTERFAGARAFAEALLPLLRQCATDWEQRCAISGVTPTAFRKTEPLRETTALGVVAEIVEQRAGIVTAIGAEQIVPASPGAAVFQADGKVLARFGEELVYFVDGRAHRVAVPPEHRPLVAASRWLTRGPIGGFAAVGPSSILLVRGSRFARLPLPRRASGGELGSICAVIAACGVFGILTAETDDSNGGAELWTTSDGVRWDPPVIAPLGGDVCAASLGPHGYLVVGSHRGSRGRALFLPFDHNPILQVAGVNDGPPLAAALCGADREAWAAGTGFVLSMERGCVTREDVDVEEPPVSLALDLRGVPWLLTHHAVLRRQVTGDSMVWRLCHRRDPAGPSFVAIGFGPGAAHILDANGDGVVLRLHPREAAASGERVA